MLGFYVFAAFLCFMFFLAQEERPGKLAARLTTETVISAQNVSMRSFVARLVPSLAAYLATKSPPNSSMKKRLQQSGLRITPEEFYAIKIIIVGIAVLFLGVVSLVSPALLLPALIAALALFIIPEFWLSSVIKKRNIRIDKDVPLAIDIVALSMDAGLPFYTALRYVTHHLPGSLGEELKHTEHEIDAGLPRSETLKNLAARTGLASLDSLAMAVISAEKYGVPVKDVLLDLSTQLRSVRRLALQERANKAGVKLAVPVIFFIIVPMFIIILGPMVMGLAGAFG